MYIRHILLIFALYPGFAFALQTAVLDVQVALQNSEAAKAFRSSLQKSTAEAESRVLELETQAKALQAELNQSQGLASSEQLEQKQLQFQKVFDEYQRQGQVLQQQRAAEEQKFLQTMRPKLDAVIKSLIEEKEISLILNRQSAIYVEPGIDITPDIIQRLNELK